jgi:hypothetical protein
VAISDFGFSSVDSLGIGILNLVVFVPLRERTSA